MAKETKSRRYKEMEPTKEQIQWFWKQFGIEERFEGDTGTWYYHYPDGQCDIESPPIDLNNLFKYAMSKVKEVLNYPQEVHGFPGERYKFHGFLQRWIYAIAIQGKDPALALFWAIYKALL